MKAMSGTGLTSGTDPSTPLAIITVAMVAGGVAALTAARITRAGTTATNAPSAYRLR
jgi:hypothetical protein